MISARTRWIMLCFLTLSSVVGIVAHRRQALCGEVPHGFARRAPIAAASGRDRFVCPAMVQKLPPAEMGLGVAWWLSLIAAARSVWIDKERRRNDRRLLDEL